MQAKEIKPGSVVVYEGDPVLMLAVQVQSPSARGAATLYKFRGRNLVSGQKIELTLKGPDSLDLADFQKREVSVMYRDSEQIHLMDSENYNQYSVDLNDISEQLPYLAEGLDGIRALIYNDGCVGLELPASIEMDITQCDPAVKGNSATSRTKPATLETGLVIQVPEYIKEGERIKVDSRTGEFLSRA